MSGSSTFDAKPSRKAPRPPRPVLRAIIVLLVLGVLLGGVFGWGAVKSMFIGKFLATLKYMPQTVSTVVAEKTPFAPTIEATGNLVAEQGASLSSQVAGIVDTISFKSGTDVKKGQVLLTLRSFAPKRSARRRWILTVRRWNQIWRRCKASKR